MRFNRIDAFAVPVFYGSLGEQSRTLNKQLVTDILDHIKDDTPQKRSGVDIHQTLSGLEDKYQSFSLLKQNIDNVVASLPMAVGADHHTAESTNYCANVDRSPYGFNMPHSHSATYAFSSVYFPSSGIVDEGKESEKFLSTNENLDDVTQIDSASHPDPGNLVLLDPLEFCKSAWVPASVKRYPYWGLPLCIHPKEGTLVIFPSYLPHMVTPTKNESLTRISIALNIVFN